MITTTGHLKSVCCCPVGSLVAAHLADNSEYISSSPGNVFVALFGFYFMLNSSFKAEKEILIIVGFEELEAHTLARRAVS